MDEKVLLVGTAVLVFIAALLFAQFLYWSMASRRQAQLKELSRRLGTLAEKTGTGGIALIKGPGKGDRKGIEADLEDMLRQAGSPYSLNALFGRMALAGFVGVLALGFAFRGPLAIMGLAVGYLPVMILSWQAGARAAKLAEQLPDGLDLLARSLQAGHGISEAMRGVAEEMPLPLGQEFGRVYEEHNLGQDFRVCLQNLCRRNPNSFDLQIFVSSVLLQRDTGGNLVEILANISNTIRQRFVFSGKLRALTSEARFTAYILGGLPFVIGGLIYTIQPNYLTPLGQDPLGHFMLLYSGCSFGLGVFLMRETTKVEI